MKTALLVEFVMIVGLFSLVGCGEATAPDATEPLGVSLFSRQMQTGEVIPSVSIEPGSGTITVRATRPNFCERISATIRRGPFDIALVFRVSSDPAGVCGGRPVAVYSGTITGITKGAHNVAVFESYEGGPARFVASRSVAVASGSTPDM